VSNKQHTARVYLSPHFTLAEMTRTSVRLPNDPPVMTVPKLTALCVNVLERVRAAFQRPVTVHSGYRSDAVNTRVGGSARSQHRKGEASDFTIDDGKGGRISNWEIAQWIIDNLDFDQLIVEFVGELALDGTWSDDPDGQHGWIHCSYVTDKPNRKSVKVARRVRDAAGRIRTQYETITTKELPHVQRRAA
jgi:zinc D-Ala-D-Ala carboxypeptidase